MPFPESVQALIAARLDTLDAEAKSLLADAAVIGKVFWAGAISAMGDRDPQTVTAALRELSRKELVRPSRHSSMAGEAEYAFWHVLARDVAYSQLPRASRATRHVAAAVVDRVESARADRRPGRCARLPLRDRPGARPGGRANRPGRRAGSTRPEVPRAGRRARPRPRHHGGPSEFRASIGAHTAGASAAGRSPGPLRRGRPRRRTLRRGTRRAGGGDRSLRGNRRCSWRSSCDGPLQQGA